MARLVQKFGGSSLADPNKIRQAAKIAVEAAKQGCEVTAVVSAMGQTTDHLIKLAEQVNPSPNLRELDMLLACGEQQSIALMSMSIQALGWPARSFTGAQAGIVTESKHGSAKIKAIEPDAVEASLNRGEIAVVAGFQGISVNAELTTLGRGGSDTTAVALATAVGADRCDIYTDVNGIFTADPNLLAEARKLARISYEEMLELAATGAKVMNYRAVATAMENDLPVQVRSAFNPGDPGTLITHHSLTPNYGICGITLDTSLTAISLKFYNNAEAKTLVKSSSSKTFKYINQSAALQGTANPIVSASNPVVSNPIEGIASLFTRLNELSIATDMVMYLAQEDESYEELIFTVEQRYEAKVTSIIRSILQANRSLELTTDSNIARVSVVGQRLARDPETIAKIFDKMNSSQIPIQMVTTGDLRTSLLLPKVYASQAVQKIHHCLGLAELF